MSHLDNVARREFDRLEAEWGLELPWDFEPNRRLTRSLGYTRLSWKGVGEAKEYTVHKIQYAPKLLTGAPDAVVIDVVRHEYAHALDWELNGKHGHGPSWQEIARIVGCVPKGSSDWQGRIDAVAASRKRET